MWMWYLKLFDAYGEVVLPGITGWYETEGATRRVAFGTSDYRATIARKWYPYPPRS